MSRKKRSWREKLDDAHGFPCVRPIDPSKTKSWGPGTFVIPAPREVDELMRRVPEGQVTTIDDLRRCLARKHGATIGCPLTTGIFAWIAAHAAAEAESEAKGTAAITPYWRTLKSNGELNPKYPGGIEGQKQRLASEGHEMIQKRTRSFVAGFQSKLANLSP